MNYYVYINGKTHRLVQGFTLTEEYNETLDSGTIIISNSPQLDLNPYDDVFIFGEWCGYYDKVDNVVKPLVGKKFEFKGYPIRYPNYDTGEMPAFYRHFLIDQFSESVLILGDNESEMRYQYTIDIFSETKGLETVQAPNISITQPLGLKTPTVNYVNRFLKLYNKIIKKGKLPISPIFGGNWSFDEKYSVGETIEKKYVCFGNYIYDNNYVFSQNTIYYLKNYNGILPDYVEIIDDDSVYPQGGKNDIYIKSTISDFTLTGSFEYARIVTLENIKDDYLETISSVFGQNYCPDFTLNNPSLRQILDKLLIAKDRITVVKDDEIFSMDITKRRGYFDLNKGQINYIIGTKSSDNHCTNLKRTYTDGLAQDSTGRYIEYLGFRNSDDALLSIENMRVETGFPIYKINKFFMCYFKRYTLTNNLTGTEYNGVFLCKQDITKLIKLNSERNTLSEDITWFNSNPPQTIDELAKYKLATLGYDIGSKYVEGWGTQYSYPDSFFWENELKTYLETIFKFVDGKNPVGIYDIDYLIKKTLNVDSVPENSSFTITYEADINDVIRIPNYGSYDSDFWDIVTSIFGDAGDANNLVLHLKHIFFEIDYTPFFSGTVIQTKGLGRGDITINDNQSSSLSLLELDGLAQKEKINRYGNKGIQISTRYKSPEQLQKLGSVYEKNLDKDIVIYHKEYSLNDNDINCTYYGSKDYVLKDYFTSVYAKHRTYNLMSYGESILRSENKHMFVLISKTKKKIVDKSLEGYFSNFDEDFLKTFLSFFDSTANIIKYEGKIENINKLNYGYFKKGNQYFASDSNIFVSGTSICLNIAMRDNVTVGNYILDMHNEYINSKKNDYMMGATQDFAWLTDAADGVSGGTTGFLTKLGFYFGHVGGENNTFIDEDKVYIDGTSSEFNANDIYKNKLFKLPIISSLPQNITNVIGFEKDIYKDNKERIDMTVQFEPIADDEIYLSQWVVKLSDLFGTYSKFKKDTPYSFKTSEEVMRCVNEATMGSTGSEYNTSLDSHRPGIIVIIDTSTEDWQKFLNGGDYAAEADFYFPFDSGWDNQSGDYINTVTELNVEIRDLVSFDSNSNTLVVKAKIYGEIGRPGDEEHGYDRGPFEILQNITLNNSTYPWSSMEQSQAETAWNDEHRGKILEEAGLSNDSKYLILRYYFDNRIYLDGKNRYWTCYPESGGKSSSNTSVFGYGYYKKQSSDFIVSKVTEINKTYPQNLFWVAAAPSYDFREYMVYDELDTLNIPEFTQLSVWEAGDPITNHDIELNFIVTSARDEFEIIHPVLDYGSHILCYYKTDDGKYNFVFGFKPDENPNNSGKTNSFSVLYLSLLSFKDLTIYDEDTNLPIGDVPTE